MVLLNDCFLSLEPIKIMSQISIHAQVFLFLFASGWSHSWENQKAGAEETQPPLPSPLYVQLSGASRGFLHLSSPLRSRKPLDLRADLSIGLIPPLGDQGSMWSLRNAWDWSPPPSPLYARLSGALQPRGSEEKQGGRAWPATGSVLSQPVPTQADHLVLIFHSNAPPNGTESPKIRVVFVVKKIHRKNTGTISGVHWTPGDHLSKQCILYHNELLCRQVGS